MTLCSKIPIKAEGLISYYGYKKTKDSNEFKKEAMRLNKIDSEAYDFVAGLTGESFIVDDPVELAIGSILTDQKAVATTPESKQLFQCLNANPNQSFKHSILLLRSLMRQNSDDMPRLKKEEQKYMEYGGISKAEADSYCRERVEKKVNDIINKLSKEPGSSMPKLLPQDKQLIIDYLLLKKDINAVFDRAEEWINNAKAKEYKVLTEEKGQLIAFHNLFLKMTSKIEGAMLSGIILSGIKAPMDD